ncbi:meiosis initiator protein isoform X3 [Sceloporus undulatus]|uniref:meiosis initiator protein isoform X3 n=1 Tax=Sceloporus undulatus TaxID=8520 RepID=UPI001C4D74B6|nr:meiosis initiator protein isoform X3 [Sceloporus undulatus]
MASRRHRSVLAYPCQSRLHSVMGARPRRRRARAFPPLGGLCCEPKMGNPTGLVCTQKSKTNSKNIKQNLDGSRISKRNNYASTLKELAEMLPIPLQTGCKRLTKKEIIFRVLRYIEHLQSSIDTAKSLLRVNSEGSKEETKQVVIPVIKRGRREATPRTKKTEPLNVGKKPRKRKRARRAERRSVIRKARKCLSLEAENIPSQADVHREESVFAAGKEPLVLSSSQEPTPFFPSLEVLVSESHQPTDWNLDSNQQECKEEETAFSVCAAQVAYNEQYQQELVYYNSSYEEEDEEGPRASPWLSAQSPVGITHESLQLFSPGTGTQSNSCSDLGLSPSLFSSPSRLLPRHILQGGQEALSPVLFEDVYLSPQSSNFSQTLSRTLLRKSALTMDHCYLSYNEMGKSNPSPVSRVNEIASSSWHKPFFKEEAATLRPECPMSSSDENSDSTWVPCKRARKPLQVASQKKKKKVVRRQKCQALACEKHSSSSPLKLKKKCVNGFIMFCRLNRKHFIRAYPGMASTEATRELAQLWRVMTKQERKPYCLKARRFSLLNNRIVRDDFSSGEDDLEPPKPFHLLLAEKSIPNTQFFHDLSLLELIP